MEWCKYALSALLGAVVAYLKGHALLFWLVVIAVTFDLITGMLAAVISGEGLSSDKARKGFLKKVVLLIALGFGTFLDVLIPWAAVYIGLPIPETMLFSAMICTYICITESISIVENIYKCNDHALPMWIKKLLQQAGQKLEEASYDETTHSR